MKSAICEYGALKTQLEADLKAHQIGHEEAKGTIAKAIAIREKEAAAFAKTESDLITNIAALGKAIPAIEKGCE